MTTLIDCLERGAARASAEKVAVAGRRDSLEWGELLRGARGIAAVLRDAGVGYDDRVGIWMEKSAACVQAIVGVLIAGAAYVPLDPRSPWPRCLAIALDCRFAALVVDASRLEVLPPFLDGERPAVVIVHGDEDGRAPAATRGAHVVDFAEALAAPHVAIVPPTPDDLAYILYTSGSTGTPKGVAHTHSSGAAFVNWVQQRFGIEEDDVFSSHAPFHFDLSISDLFASLGAGAAVRLITAAEGMLAPYLVRMLDLWGITVWYSVPSVLIAMLEQGGLEQRPPQRLRQLFFAGEVFPTPQLRRLRRALPRVRLVNLFGPTETNVCTYYEVGRRLRSDCDRPIPIGIGCEHMDTFIVDDEGRPVNRPGVEGTLWVKGDNVMRGYWNDPARTAQMIAPDPRGTGGVACCTGDRVRLMPDGNYEFRGRRDHLVKTRGYRVELGEIEATLAAHPAVREAVAVPLPDEALGNRIVVSVVPRLGEAVDTRSLRAYLGGKLPSYMVPAGIEVRSALPRTSTGKADRNVLRNEWERRDLEEGNDGAAVHSGDERSGRRS